MRFLGRSEKQDGRPGLWLDQKFSTSPLKPLNGIQPNLTGSKISTSFTKFVLFGPIGKTRWPPWPLIGWEIFDFSSETAEQNAMKLDRKQDLNILYQICVFVGPVGKTRWPPWPLIGWDIFDFSSETTERNSTKLDRKQDLNVLYKVCVFWADRKNKMAALVSDWLRHFRLFLWNRWTACNETWQEERSQRPLPSLCFWADRKNKMAALANPSKRWHIVLRCTMCGPLGLLFYQKTHTNTYNQIIWFWILTRPNSKKMSQTQMPFLTRRLCKRIVDIAALLGTVHLIFWGGAWDLCLGRIFFFGQYRSKVIFFAGPSGRIIFFITESYKYRGFRDNFMLIVVFATTICLIQAFTTNSGWIQAFATNSNSI